MARSYRTRDPYLACPQCGQHWPETDQACACDSILGKCCGLPLYREWRSVADPGAAELVMLVMLGVIIGGVGLFALTAGLVLFTP